MVKLKEGERLDDLQYNGLTLIQNPDYYCFTSDAVLLANYEKYKGKLCEFGTGSGVISVLAAAKNDVTVSALELQDCMADIAERNVENNGLSERITVVRGDIKNAPQIFGCGVFDCVLVNPPYRKAESGEHSHNPVSEIARHEVAITLDEIIKSAASVLKYGGKLYMVNRAERLAEIVFSMKSNNLEPKKITLYRASRNTDRVIVKAVLGGKVGVSFDVE